MDLTAKFPLCQAKHFSVGKNGDCFNLWRVLANPHKGKAAMKNKELAQKPFSQI